MLAHGRRDGYAFRDHESDRVDSDGDGTGSQACTCLVQGGSSIVVTTGARHDGKGVGSKVCMRQ
jgi:hypothetical protein